MKRKKVNKKISDAGNTSTTMTSTIDVLRASLPYGHPHFVGIAYDMMHLHNDKNRQYASGGHPLGNFQRVANIMRNYQNLEQGDPAVALIGMVIKQIDNILWSLDQKRFYKQEQVMAHLGDVAVYFTILQCMWQDAQSKAEDRSTR